MSAYHFSSLTAVSAWGENRSRVGPLEGWQTWLNLSNQIIQGGTPDEAESRVRAGLLPPAEQKDKMDVRILKISGAEFVGHLLTETGNDPIDWPEVSRQAQLQLEAGAADSFERGHWVDQDSVVRPAGSSESIDELRAALPEEIRLGLNWAPEKQFYFVLTVFSTKENSSLETPDPDEIPQEVPQEETDEDSGPGPDGQTLEELCQSYPQIRDKEAAAVILARNLVVAAWLWRRYAKGTRAADNEIRIDEWLPI